MLKILLSTALLSLCATGAVLANDASGTEWSGLYFGLQAGSDSSALSKGVVSADFPDSTDIGAHFGYMRDMGAVVVGGEAEYGSVNFVDIDGDATVLRLKARVGYDAGKLLPYLTVGIANFSTDGSSDDISESGLSAGLGIDYMATDKFIVGAELLTDTYNRFAEDEIGVSGVTYTFKAMEIRASLRF